MSEMIDKQNVIDLVSLAIGDDWCVDYTIDRINEMPVVNNEDIVSRQQVIDTIMGEPSETYYPCYFAEMIRELPATHPEVIRCRNCKFSHMTNDGRYCKYCDMFTDDYGQLIEMYFESNFYCGYAERKINERTG